MWYRKKIILDNDSLIFLYYYYFQGDVADEDIMDDMLSTENKGKDAFETFMRERLNPATKDVFSPITQLKLKTFKKKS